MRFLTQNKDIIDFFTTGMDSGFKFSEIMLLHNIAKEAQLEEPIALYLSVPALNQAIAKIIRNAREQGTESSDKIQSFLSKMYQYRTKIELDPKNNHTMKTTKSLVAGQRLRIVLKGMGVFSSRVINSGRELVIELPYQRERAFFGGSEWIGKSVSVYLNRPGDASYVFDSVVHNAVTSGNKTSLFLAHSNELTRTQKRKSVRCSCQIFAQLYLVRPEMDKNAVEVEPGLKCLIEDISEDGAMIRIGGAGKKDINIKVQFALDDKMVVMFGIVRAVEYNQGANQSRLHFEYIEPDPIVKNNILTYVYKILPQDEKERLEAIEQIEKDEAKDAAAAEGLDIPSEIPDEAASVVVPDFDPAASEKHDDKEEIQF